MSEKTAGLSPDVSTVIVSEKLAGRAGPDVVLQGDDKVIAPSPAVVLHGDDKVIDRTPGAALHPDSRARRPGPSVADYRLRPVEVVTASDRRFDWADAGIASALTLASILGAAGAALTIRRRRGSLAH